MREKTIYILNNSGQVCEVYLKGNMEHAIDHLTEYIHDEFINTHIVDSEESIESEEKLLVSKLRACECGECTHKYIERCVENKCSCCEGNNIYFGSDK